MIFLRAMLIWVLALSLPVQGMAASVMTHCKVMQKTAVMASGHAMSGHDHAAMMAMAVVADDAAIANLHDPRSGSVNKPSKTLKLGCQCGCQCGGDCVLSCTGMMVSLMPVGFRLDSRSGFIFTVLSRGQAHAAYRYDALRPPSAVAL